MNSKNAKHYQKALRRIPWATQTNAKRWHPDEMTCMPPFIKRAKGCRLWDLDDREYIDYRCALGPIILGYGYPEVETAVREQMKSGVLFSMASPIELETAEAIIENVSWVEQIRFMKTGADTCTSCVRLARAYTRRHHILTSGYHGYHDWFVLNWPNSGVPAALKEFVHEIQFNDIKAIDCMFKTFGEKIAATIIVPYEWNEAPAQAYLQHLRQKCDEYGTLLIFDEVLTGFRLAPGGAQEYFGVTPDLAAYAKAMANGYPLAAFAGKEKYMQTLNETILTTTYGGETLSLAACKATMKILKNDPVHEHIFAMGDRLMTGFKEIIQATGVPARVVGLPPAPSIRFEFEKEEENRAFQNKLFSTLCQNGIFPNEPWFITYSHQAEDIDQTLGIMEHAVRQCNG